MSKRDLGEPWSFVVNAVTGLGDHGELMNANEYDCPNVEAGPVGERIAAYSHAFHDLRDPEQWRKAVDLLIETIVSDLVGLGRIANYVEIEQYIADIRKCARKTRMAQEGITEQDAHEARPE